jgi:hypothetical protein
MHDGEHQRKDTDECLSELTPHGHWPWRARVHGGQWPEASEARTPDGLALAHAGGRAQTLVGVADTLPHPVRRAAVSFWSRQSRRAMPGPGRPVCDSPRSVRVCLVGEKLL